MTNHQRETVEMETIINKSVFDKVENTRYPLTSVLQTLQEAVFFYIGEPAKGDFFQLIEETATGHFKEVRMPGGDANHTRKVFRPISRKDKIIETWQWTGQWKQHEIAK